MQGAVTRSREQPGSESPPRLLVVLPALDEERTVADVVRGVPRNLPAVESVEVVVVDDGSRDATAARAREAGARVLQHPQPRGVGAAFHTGLAYGIESGAGLILSIDADGQFDPAEVQAHETSTDSEKA